jgi:hypothetical protein
VVRFLDESDLLVGVEEGLLQSFHVGGVFQERDEGLKGTGLDFMLKDRGVEG